MPKRAKNSKITTLIFPTYLAVIKNSVGSKLFRNFYANVNGKKIDVMHDGELSCAFYTSSVLSLFKFIEGVHATVDSLVKDLEVSGWERINKPKVGAVLVWEEKASYNKETHKHAGFFIGRGKAISNVSKFGIPMEHSWTFDTKRKVEKIFWYPKLKA